MKIKKYQQPAGNLPYQPADNTRVAWNPQQQGMVVARTPNPGKVDITDNPMGYAPIVGDVLQGGQAIIDFSQGDWKSGLLNTSLLLVPNLLEKPVKAAIKAAKSSAKDPLKEAVERGIRAAEEFIKSEPVKKSLSDNRQKHIIKSGAGDAAAPKYGARPVQSYLDLTSVHPQIEIAELPDARGRAFIGHASSGEFISNPETARQYKIKISEDLIPERAESTAFHERLHTIGYGDRGSNPLNPEIAKSVLVPESEMLEGTDPEFLKYLSNPAETAAWYAQAGRDLGLKPGQEYIGTEAFKNLILDGIDKNNNLSTLVQYTNLTSEGALKNFWKALTGTLFGAAATALSIPYIKDQLQENGSGNSE